MKTTLDLPEPLLRRAKRQALERRTTLKALVVSGLKRELQRPGAGEISPIAQLRSISADVWRGVKADTYVRGLRQNWK
jgi:hypothetical protein